MVPSFGSCVMVKYDVQYSELYSRSDLKGLKDRIVKSAPAGQSTTKMTTWTRWVGVLKLAFFVHV